MHPATGRKIYNKNRDNEREPIDTPIPLPPLSILQSKSISSLSCFSRPVTEAGIGSLNLFLNLSLNLSLNLMTVLLGTTGLCTNEILCIYWGVLDRIVSL